jgi:quinoprotein glucose dehydrogenase
MSRRILLALVASLASAFLQSPPTTRAAERNTDWPNVFNDKQGTRYSPLDQINRNDVKDLKIAWVYHTGDSAPGKTIECTPLVIEGVMYVTTVTTKAVALDATTGLELWKYDPYTNTSHKWKKASGGVNRGVAYWSDGQPDGQRRILLGLSDGRLISLDAKTGKPDPAFAKEGVLDLREGLTEGNFSSRSYGPTSAPLVFENNVILGVSNDEASPAAPGDPRAFDVRTGKEVWRFHSIPREGEFGADAWAKDGWRNRGGANAWGGLTLDPQTGIVYMGLGSATSDFYGKDRPINDLFSDCALALDARTGKRIWHFQTVHHDLWDHDNPCPPVVVTVKHEGKERKAVAQCTKTGYCFLLDAQTGVPIFGVKEVPAPMSDIPGENSSPTQPVPIKPPPFSRVRFTEEDATDISPAEHDLALKKLKTLRHDGQFVNPPGSIQGTVEIPGFHGGATWSGASFDPTTGYLYVSSNNVPNIVTLRKFEDRYVSVGYAVFEDRDGHPAIKPPWGLLTAIDLNTGDFAWQVPLGDYPDLREKGVKGLGSENFGGTIVTAGGLIFIGGSKDEMFHAYDKFTGKLLWEHKLNAGGYATPSTYRVNGRQYIVIAAGGGGKNRTKSGDEFVVFALEGATK